MDARELISTEVYRYFRRETVQALLAGLTWDDQTFLRACIIRQQHGDASAWHEFVKRLEARRDLVVAIRVLLEQRGWVWFDPATNRFCMGAFPTDVVPLGVLEADALLDCLSAAHKHVAIRPALQDEPLHCLLAADQLLDHPEQLPSRLRESRSEIMYVESKPGLTGHARIGRVIFSKTRKTIYYRGYKFRSLKGGGYKANFRNIDTGMSYWISRCRADGQDTLYPGIVEIDDDVREEYWLTIRNRPEMVNTASFRSEGKYSKRRPR